tara:strand:- start:2173 stop:2592 length:420 start_codon:yes stop_codon:yes gene_type:complete
MSSIDITEYRNAVSLNEDNTRMDVEINHPEFGWGVYTLDINDTDYTINNDDLLALIGTDFEPYVPPTQEEQDAKLARFARMMRDAILVDVVDPIVSNPLRWADMTTEKQNEWAAYRTALLQVPEQTGFPSTISWPTKPE